MDAALLILRLALGLAMAGHGAQKMLGWFGGPGMAGTTGFMRGLRFRPAGVYCSGISQKSSWMSSFG